MLHNADGKHNNNAHVFVCFVPSDIVKRVSIGKNDEESRKRKRVKVPTTAPGRKVILDITVHAYIPNK